MLFESVANSRWFTNSAIILFLNKMDIFTPKVKMSPVQKYFPDYKGDPTDWNVASKYFLHKFQMLNRNPEKEIYAHFTTATDTDLLSITMRSVRDLIIQRNLRTFLM